MSRSIRSYQREVKRLKRLIAEMLWVQPSYNGSPSCAYCGQQQHLHAEHCVATRLIAQEWPEDDRVRRRAVEQG